ncbi:hypothetical protein [Armatimonas rosea]|uniref:hypothetical protein n=1 Tax=Armatimonas rosea TaxID=685828 RepID=UPI0016165737|nr:hypothetical protein [Armatimonas rosea]
MPVEFRLSALSELMGREESTEEVPGEDRRSPDTGRQAETGTKGRSPDTQASGKDSGELVEQLRSEVAFLRSALEREQLTTQALASRLEDSDKRLAAVLAGTGRLRIEDSSNQRIEPSGLAESSHADDTAPGGGITPPSQAERPWWQFWKGKS